MTLYAPGYEHVEVLAEEARWFLDHMQNDGALFLGPETNVAYGDKVIKTNDTLPIKGASRYTGSLWAGKLLTTCSHQQILRKSAPSLAATVTSRSSLLLDDSSVKERNLQRRLEAVAWVTHAAPQREQLHLLVSNGKIRSKILSLDHECRRLG